jgi:hypothetical protein
VPERELRARRAPRQETEYSIDRFHDLDRFIKGHDVTLQAPVAKTVRYLLCLVVQSAPLRLKTESLARTLLGDQRERRGSVEIAVNLHARVAVRASDVHERTDWAPPA